MKVHRNNRFVAHFDMLGMSTLVRRDPDLAWQKLCDLNRACVERMRLGIGRRDTGELVTDRVRWFFFSDTVIAFSLSDTQNDVQALLILTTEIFTRAMHYCVPLRGGVAHGRFDFNLEQNLFSGPALVDAYEIGESSQWLGIVVDDRTTDVARSVPLQSAGHDVIVRWNVPTRDVSSAERNVVNWVQTHRDSYRGPVPLTTAAFYSPFASLFGPLDGLDERTRAKYANTVEFFNANYDPGMVP